MKPGCLPRGPHRMRLCLVALLESRVCGGSGSGPSVGNSMEFGGGRPGFIDYGAGTSVTERDEA